LEVAGDFEGRGLGIDEGERDLRLVGLKSLVLEGISAKGKEQVTVSRMRLDKLHLLEPLGKKTEGEAKPSVLSLGGATLEQIDVRGSREFRISSVEFKDAIASLRRDPEGRWDLIDHVLAGRDTNQSAEQKETESPLVIAIGNVQILGDSQLNFDDEGVSPPYRTTLLLNEARIADIDSAKPEQLSPLNLIGKVGKYSRVALNGYLKPFTERLSLHLTGKIQALDLPPLSPYVSGQLGYNLRSGRLDADIDLRVDLGELDASSKLLVNNLEVTPSDPGKFDKLTTQLTMPLPVALSMLRDKNRDIRLELPVTGDISSPKFDLSDAINKALGKAMKFAALGFVKHVLQPYGTMITIAEWTVKGAKKGAAIRLDPVIFGPGSAALSETAREYLDKVSQLMADRPELRIKLCGLATEGDRMALGGTAVLAPSDQSRAKSSGEKKAEDAGTEPPAATAPPLIGDEQLEDLAKRRASTIMDYFIKEHGIEVERLFVCHPEVDTGEEAQSRVELLI